MKFRCVTAVIRTLAAIAPPTGWHTLAGRVYPTLIVPERLAFVPEAGERWAYCCVPLVGDPGRYVRLGTMLTRSFEIRVYAFVGERSEDSEANNEVEDLAKLEDDMVRALLLNPRLDQSCDSFEIETTTVHAGWPVASKRYGELEMVLRITQSLDTSQLGRQAG